jgi:type IV pilus assembly protein PilM
MLNFFSNLFKKSDASVIGIDIGSSAIKVVQIRKKGGRAVLETYGALALGPYAGVEVGRATNLPVEKVVEALSDILREAKVTSNKGGLAIPFSSSLMTVIEMPMVSESQLASMIPIEARKYVPVPISEVNLDWSIIPRDQKPGDAPQPESEVQKSNKVQKTDVLLVAIHNDTIRELQEIINRAKLDANFFEVEIFSTMRSVIDQNIEPVMIMDMGAASTKLYIAERGAIRNSHTINKGSQDITTTISTSLGIPIDRAEVMKRTVGLSGESSTDISQIISITLDHIFAETKRVILNYEAKYAKTITKVYLVGGGVSMKGFAAVAQKNLETPVISGDPFAKVQAPAFLENVLKINGPEFAVAVGIALRRLQEGK